MQTSRIAYAAAAALLVACGGTNTSEVNSGASGGFTVTGSMVTPRAMHTATLLSDGRVLITGGFGPFELPGDRILSSTELYDPATGTFTAAGSMTSKRIHHTATLLPNGKVLIAGGTGGNPDDISVSESALYTAELYDPATGTFTGTADMSHLGNSGMLQDRVTNHSATLLSTGKVLVAGHSSVSHSDNSGYSAYLYDPATETFTPTSTNSRCPASGPNAVLLSNGTVIRIGCPIRIGNAISSSRGAELYDPAADTFTGTGTMLEDMSPFGSALLPNGKVLVVSGSHHRIPSEQSAELYDPATGAFGETAAMSKARFGGTVTSLPNGKVLVVGGSSGVSSYAEETAEVYNPSTDVFTGTGSMGTPRVYHTATLLSNGRVLITGGRPAELGDALTSAELYSSQ